MPYSVALIGAEGANDKVGATTAMFRMLLERDLGDVERAYRDWLAANNIALLCVPGELPSSAQLAVNRWICAYTQARLIALAAYQGDARLSWFDVHLQSN